MMTTIGSLLQASESPQSASLVRNQLRNIEEKGADLLELRTEAGVVYVCPSRLQRIRLRWAFRHFHVLPPQVLSRRDQRLIEKLSWSAVVTPALPLAGNTVFGVVEKMRSKPPALAGAMVAQGTELAGKGAPRVKPAVVDVPRRESREASVAQRTAEVRLRHWAALGAVAAVCIAVLLVLVYRVHLFSSIGQLKNPRTLSTPVKYAAYDRKPLGLHPAASGTHQVLSETASAKRSKRSVAPSPPPPLPGYREARVHGTSHDVRAGLAPIVASAATKPPFVSQLPHRRLVYPDVSGRNLVGELQLKALIGADGSVKKVTVLSGSPKLAKAGVRAVRRWRYQPYQVLGSPIEVETRIKISFFGPDAVSIASVGNEPSYKLK